MLTPEQIPEELRLRPQWVLWREEMVDGKKTKVPYQPRSPQRKASSTTPATWGTFAQALSVAKTNGFGGVGYVFSPQDDYAGVDLDKCRDQETGQLKVCAQVLIDYLQAYTEISPSGTGLHFMIKGKVPPGGNIKGIPCGGKVEMYDSGRYFTMTGLHLEGTPTTIEDRQAELETLHGGIFGQAQTPPRDTGNPSPTLDLSDSELIEKARQAANGEKFSKLWGGDTAGHDSPSEATAALLNHLAFWCGPDPERIDRLFRQSGLIREKWDRPQSGSTWGNLEIHKAIVRAKEFYKSGQGADQDYDQAERAAIQGEAGAKPKTSINSSILTRELSTRVKKALEAAGLKNEEIVHVVNILDKSEKARGDFNFSAEVREWVLSTSGHFTSTDVHRELALSTVSTDQRRVNKTLSQILSRLCEEGDLIERDKSRRGHFRRVERESQALDFLRADCSRVLDLKWPAPFHLERWANLYPKNIIIVAGASNAGKTALLLNVVKENMAKHRIAYFSSEMGPEELRLRLSKFQMPLSAWKFEAYERAANFSDAVFPDAVNLIDYLELTDSFYQVGGQIKAIFDRLTTGVAIIALQKKEGVDLGRGGDFTREKARLYLSMDSGELKIIKGKNWATPGVNPNDRVFKFKLVDGARFIESGS